MTTERVMTTERKKEAARLNGAKSRGPVTAEGKARSSQNAVTHGLLSNTILLPGESEQQFQQLLDSLIQTYRPETDAEAKLVEQISAVTWFQLRLLGIETETLATRIELQAQVLDAHVADLSPSRRIALAYAELADTSRVPANLDRHSTRLGRQLDRLQNQLIRLQALRPQPDDSAPEADSAPSDSDSSLLPPDSTTKFPNEPTGEQPLLNEQRGESVATGRADLPQLVAIDSPCALCDKSDPRLPT